MTLSQRNSCPRLLMAGAGLRAIVIALCILVVHESAIAQTPIGNTNSIDLREAIESVEDATGYSFTYRDRLVERKTIGVEAKRATVEEFLALLFGMGIGSEVDTEARQILLFEQKASTNSDRILRGRIVDDQSQAGLAYATISWITPDGRAGVASTPQGSFQLSASEIDQQPIGTIAVVSYVGYESKQVILGDLSTSDGVVIGLERIATDAPEVVVSDLAISTDLDSSFVSLLDQRHTSSLGEGNVLKSLQGLPSISVSTGLADGLNVRGSSTDAFQVLLDGMPIYNQSHFFGLFDALNEDALQRVGLYYGITPATYQGAPGGTLAFVTRNGPRDHIESIFGLSNTSAKATLAGPLPGSIGTWVVSYRRSVLNEFDWFGNASIIEQGLNVNRRTSVEQAPIPQRRAVIPGISDATYYDGHAKISLDVSSTSRVTISGYVGGDQSQQLATRFLRPRIVDVGDQLITRSDVRTSYDWGSDAISIQYQNILKGGKLFKSLLGRSRFNSDYYKDDFTYDIPPLVGLRNTSITFIDTLSNANSLEDVVATTEIGLPVGGNEVSVGASLHNYSSSFIESSALRELPYTEKLTSSLTELFGEFATSNRQRLNAQLGLRVQYYSSGDQLNWSPRLKLSAGRTRVSAYVGFSRNYQYLHRLYLENTVGSYLWTTSTAEEPPGEQLNLVSGLTLRPIPRTAIQVDVYSKRFNNLRQHESLVSRRRLRNDGATLSPWVHDARGQSRGLEVLMRNKLGRAVISNGYTFSRTTLRNDAIQDGRVFLAEWDRTHQFTSRASVRIGESMNIEATWLVASGATNVLAYSDPLEPERLGRYDRLDLGLQYQASLGSAVIELRFNLFNAYNKANPWYRTNVAVIETVADRDVISYVNADVYDLGVQPSFEVKVRL